MENTITVNGVEYVRKDSGPSGIQIAVLDRGFVYIGMCRIDQGFLIITNARNIRRFGTTKGLGQLAIDGPQPETALDDVGTVRAPIGAVMHLIDVDENKWND